MAGTFTKNIIAGGEDNKEILTTTSKNKAEEELTFEDRARLSAAGLLMEFGEEGEALFESLFSSDDDDDKLTFSERYAKNLKENQKALKDARSKEGSLKYEIGGAIIPGLLTLPLGGAGAAGTLGRVVGSGVKELLKAGGKKALTTGQKLATVGASQGTAVAIGSGEESNILDRLDSVDDYLKLGKGAVIGGSLNWVGGKAAEKILSGLSKLGGDKLARALGNELGKPVENELKRIATSSNLTVDEIVANIQSGKIIPEMDTNIADVVRGFVAVSHQGGAIIKDTATKRAKDLRRDVVKTVQKDLAPDTNLGNVKAFFNESENNIKAMASKAYTKIFKGEGQDTANYQNIGDELLKLNKNNPEVGKIIESYISRVGLGKIFTTAEDGTTQLGRNVNLEVGESIKRALMDYQKKLSSPLNKEGNLAYEIMNLEKKFANLVDGVSPILGKTRSTWASIQNNNNKFALGQSVMNKSADDIEIIMRDITKQAKELKDPKLLDSFKMGFVSSLRAKAGTTSMNTYLRNVMKEDSNVKAVLETMYPKAKFNKILQKIENAEGALMNVKKFKELSPTAESMIKSQSVGSKQINPDLEDLKSIGKSLTLTANGIPSTSFIAPAKNLIAKYVNPTTKLTEVQMEQVARLLVSEDANLIRAALTDITARNTLIRNMNKAAELIVAGSKSVSGIVGTSKLQDENFNPMSPAFADEINTGDYKVITDLTKTISPKTREKLMKIYADGTYGEVYDDTGEEVVGTRRKPTQN